MTDQRRVESQLREAKATLEDTVRVRTAELSTTVAQVREQAAEKEPHDVTLSKLISQLLRRSLGALELREQLVEAREAQLEVNILRAGGAVGVQAELDEGGAHGGVLAAARAQRG